MRELPNKNRKRKSGRAKNPTGNKINRGTRAIERHLLEIYNGQHWLGRVEQRGDVFVAKTIDGKKLGAFRSMKAAADAMAFEEDS